MVPFLDIRYIKLHFVLTILYQTELPANKASGIRGGIGEMLLRTNCIRDRKCEACDFGNECVVQRIMYSKFDTYKPKSVTSGESVGYVIECEDYRTSFEEGDELSFNLILFGKNIVYFNQYLQAVYMLGQCGLGKHNSKYMVKQVFNSKKVPILDGADVYMKNYQVSTLREYVEYRLDHINCANETYTVNVLTPATIKYQGEILRTFDAEAFLKAAYRRIYILNCFENNLTDEYYEIDRLPHLISQEVHRGDVRRYSFRKDEAMIFSGIRGEFSLGNVSREVLEILLAGEILHVGKNTSFGFGKYRINTFKG